MPKLFCVRLARVVAAIGIGAGSMAGLAQEPDQPPPSDQPVVGETETHTGPELWIHGIADADRLTQVSAHGVRLILNVRKDLQLTAMQRKIAQLQRNDLGLVVTIRWQDPDARRKPVRLDTAPSAEQGAEVSDLLLQVLNLPESRAMQGRLWVQFYNEVAGGPGTIMPEQADGLYDWATQTAQRIRAEAPHVRIAGPALTSLDPLDKSPAEGSTAALRREGLLRAINWSIQHADAVDIHLHCAGGDDARDQLEQLRSALEQAGRRDMPVVSLEWSPARFAARTSDLPGAEAAMKGIYAAMAEQQVLIAAYAAFADTALKGTYEWAYLWDKQGRPHEPFFSLYKHLSSGGAGGESDDQPESADPPAADEDDGH